MLTLFCTPPELGAVPIRNYALVRDRADAERYGALFRQLFDRGIYLAPSQFEAMFVSLAHGDEEIDRTIEAVESFRA